MSTLVLETWGWAEVGRFMGVWKLWGHSDAVGHTNQWSLPLWSILASSYHSRRPQITDASPGNQFPAMKEHKDKCLLMHKHLFSPASHSYCQQRTPFVYENGMSVIFPPSAHTDEHQTHTHAANPSVASTAGCAADQLSCWIPNKIYSINLSHTGIVDWYQGRETAQSIS